MALTQVKGPFVGVSGHYIFDSQSSEIEFFKDLNTYQDNNTINSYLTLDRGVGGSFIVGYNLRSYLFGLNIEKTSVDFSSTESVSKKTEEALSEDITTFYLSLDKFFSLSCNDFFEAYFGVGAGVSGVDFFGTILYENPDVFSTMQTLKASINENNLQRLFLCMKLGVAYNLNDFSSFTFGYKMNYVQEIDTKDIEDTYIKELDPKDLGKFSHAIEIGFKLNFI